MKDAQTHELSGCEASLDLLPAFVWVLRSRWLILLTGLIFAIGTFVCVKLFVAPQYSSQLKIYVDNHSMTNTYAEIIDGRTILEQASERIEVPLGYEELCDMVTVSSSKETGIITVCVITDDPLSSQMLTQAIADVAMEQISIIVEGSSMQILDKPEMAATPCAPKALRSAILGGSFGIVACICAIFLLYVLDINVNTDTLSIRFGLPVFECISDEAHSKGSTENIQETYRVLRTNIAFSLTGHDTACLAITCDDCLSAKSNAAINLAVTFAQSGKRVLLIDCDMQEKTLSNLLGMEKQSGLSDILIENASFEDVCYRDVAGVDILSAGKGSSLPKMLLESDAVDLLIQKAKETYDYIFLDLASMRTAADAIVMARCSDGFLLILRQNKTKNKAVEKMIGKLTMAGGKILGFIVYGVC